MKKILYGQARARARLDAILTFAFFIAVFAALIWVFVEMPL